MISELPYADDEVKVRKGEEVDRLVSNCDDRGGGSSVENREKVMERSIYGDDEISLERADP